MAMWIWEGHVEVVGVVQVVEAVGAPRRLRQAPQAGETVVCCAQFRVVVCALVSGREWLLDCR